MSLQVKKGSFTAITGTGVQSVTGVGFRPKVYILWTTDGNQTTEGFQANATMDIGFSDGTTDQDTVLVATNGSNPSDCIAASFGTPPQPVINVRTAGADRFALTSSLDSDGFTVNWQATGNATLIHYLCIGGSDLVNAKIVLPTSPLVTGSQTITGAGFTPDCAIFLLADLETIGGQFVAFQSIGAAVSSSKQWALSQSGTFNISSSASMHANTYQRTDSVILIQKTAEAGRAAFTGFTSDGCTLNWASVYSASINTPFVVLFLQTNGQVDCGAFSKSTAGAPVTDTATPFGGAALSLVGALFATNGAISSTSVGTPGTMMIGGSDFINEGCVWSQIKDVTIPLQADARFTTGKAITIATLPSTVNAEADSTSSGSNFSLTWTTNNAVASQVLWLAFGQLSAPVGIIADEGADFQWLGGDAY